jgi:hypothetical protein
VDWYRPHRILSILIDLSSNLCLSLCRCFLPLFYFYLYSINTADFSFHFYLHFMSLINTTVDLGGSYRQFRCPSIYFHCYLPQTTVVRHFLLWALLCWSCPDLRLAQPGGPTTRISVLSFFPEDGRRSSFRNVILFKFRRWTKSKKTILQILQTNYKVAYCVTPSIPYSLHLS